MSPANADSPVTPPSSSTQAESSERLGFSTTYSGEFSERHLEVSGAMIAPT